jgi:hypothetical protein
MTTLARTYRTTLILGLSLFIAGCDAIAGIFRAGFWVGAIIVFLVIGLILFFVRGRR